MRRSARPRLTYANVMVTILAVIVLGGGTAFAAYVVSSNSQIAPDTVSGHNPPANEHANIISGSIDARDIARRVVPEVRRIDFNPSGCGGCIKDIYKAHGLTLSAVCDFSDSQYLQLTGRTSLADSSLNWMTVQGHLTGAPVTAIGGFHGANAQVVAQAYTGAPVEGQLIYRGPSVVVTIPIHLEAEDIGSSCEATGTATAK